MDGVDVSFDCEFTYKKSIQTRHQKTKSKPKQKSSLGFVLKPN